MNVALMSYPNSPIPGSKSTIQSNFKLQTQIYLPFIYVQNASDDPINCLCNSCLRTEIG